MAKTQDVNQQELIKRTALALKEEKKVEMPNWANFVRTGRSKDRPPENLDWWYMRASAILRKIYLFGPIGTEKLKTKFGSKKNRGYKPEKFFPASGKVIRTILQQLDRAGLTTYKKEGVHKGRITTKEGNSFLNKISGEIKK